MPKPFFAEPENTAREDKSLPLVLENGKNKQKGGEYGN